VHDGERVAAGAPLYRLQSAEQEQLLMQRGSEVAQQMANVSVARTAQAASLAQNRRELAQLQAAAQQAASDWRRQQLLADAGFVAPAAVEQVARNEALADRLLQQAEADQRAEAAIRAQSIAEMSDAVHGLQRGLQLLERTRERLLQRAPLAGTLSGFALQVGASVRAGDRLGRIDDPAGGVQLVAEVDEYWLPRLQPGLAVASDAGELVLAQALPQVQAGKVRVLLRWPADRSPASLRPGQAVDVRLQLSAPTQALLLPEGPGVQSRVYVRQGGTLHRRDVTLGRRASGLVEVLAGLHAGDDVLISRPPADSETLALP
jgi:HlyD family secretion protein